MIYQQRVPTIEAHQIYVGVQALHHIENSEIAEPFDGEDWAVEWPMQITDEITWPIHVGGKAGDFLIPAGESWRVEPAEKFLTAWVPVPGAAL